MIRLCALALCLSACLAHIPATARCGRGSELFQRSELYFGLQRPNGKRIESTSFDVFVEEYVMPQLPTGFTLLSGEGRWVAGEKDVREPSRVLIVLHKGDPAVERALEGVRSRYKHVFSQQSVLRVDSVSCARF